MAGFKDKHMSNWECSSCILTDNQWTLDGSKDNFFFFSRRMGWNLFFFSLFFRSFFFFSSERGSKAGTRVYLSERDQQASKKPTTKMQLHSRALASFSPYPSFKTPNSTLAHTHTHTHTHTHKSHSKIIRTCMDKSIRRLSLFFFFHVTLEYAMRALVYLPKPTSKAGNFFYQPKFYRPKVHVCKFKLTQYIIVHFPISKYLIRWIIKVEAVLYKVHLIIKK